jgi:integral membrane protein
MPLKYFFDLPQAVRVTGMLHGVLFVGFIFTIILLFSKKVFGFKQSILAFLLSLVPFGTFYLKRLFN